MFAELICFNQAFSHAEKRNVLRSTHAAELMEKA